MLGIGTWDDLDVDPSLTGLSLVSFPGKHLPVVIIGSGPVSHAIDFLFVVIFLLELVCASHPEPLNPMNWWKFFCYPSFGDLVSAILKNKQTHKQFKNYSLKTTNEHLSNYHTDLMQLAVFEEWIKYWEKMVEVFYEQDNSWPRS